MQPSATFFVPWDCFPPCGMWGSCRRFPRAVFSPGREAAEALQPSHPRTPISPGKAIPSSVHKEIRYPMAQRNIRIMEEEGKLQAEKGLNQTSVHLSLNLCAPEAVSFWR